MILLSDDTILFSLMMVISIAEAIGVVLTMTVALWCFKHHWSRAIET